MDGLSPLWKAVVCLTLFAAWRAQVEFRAMTSPSRRPLDCDQRCPCSGQSYLHGPYHHAETEPRDPMLASGSVASSTVVVLANALYFKGAWFQPFDQSVTTVRVPFMTTGRFEFKQHIAVYPGFRALKLPYHNDGDHAAAAFYMLLLLPDDGSDLSLAGLYDKAAAAPEFIRSHAPAEQVPVGRFMVPKFKFTFEFEASADMRKLGVTRAFQGGDFSGMVSGGNGLSISGVYHKATIEVDELGTVAAAATAVSIPLSLSAPRPPVDFVADRPFLFAIAEEKTGGVLFLGHVVNPLAG
uniref:Putative serpin-Z12 n=1 Tax=Aegilops tauschii TaxID=37682 RepID=M8BXI9_AEGTA